ncbi:MAG: aromatic compound catabolic protein [Burkholderiales bacterium PBB5]|nr:MAG: aromatic compound catabolic protein [Burkholderiales bacterium PBB5]
MSNAQETLASWQAVEADLKARHHHYGVARPDQIMHLSGLQVFDAMAQGHLPAAPIAQTLDFMLVETSAGRAVFQGRPQMGHFNPLGTVHGGWIATLLDSAVGCAVHTTLPPGKAYTTLELKVNYVKAVTLKQALLRAEGTVISAGARVATAEGRLVGPDGVLYAHATTTCLIFDAPGARAATA